MPSDIAGFRNIAPANHNRVVEYDGQLKSSAPASLGERFVRFFTTKTKENDRVLGDFRASLKATYGDAIATQVIQNHLSDATFVTPKCIGHKTSALSSHVIQQALQNAD